MNSAAPVQRQQIQPDEEKSRTSKIPFGMGGDKSSHALLFVAQHVSSHTLPSGSGREDRCTKKTEKEWLENSTLVTRAEIPTPEQVGKWESRESWHSSNNQKGVLGARQV